MTLKVPESVVTAVLAGAVTDRDYPAGRPATPLTATSREADHMTKRTPASRAARSTMKRLVGVFATSAILVGLGGGTALASAPVLIGDGSRPAVAVDPAGTAYIAFNGTETTNAKLHFCRLPRGASACAASLDLPIPASGDTVTRPFISVSGSTVRVLSYRYGTPGGSHDFLFTSGDGGDSFGAAVSVGDLSPDGAAVDGPEGGISLVNSAAGIHQYQRVPTDGSPAPATRAGLSTTYLYGGAVGLVDAMRPLVVFDDGAGSPTTALSVYKGAGEINDGGNWTAPAIIGPGTNAHLAGGPAGLFVMLATGGHLEVRKFGTTAFGAPTVLPSSDAARTEASDLVQDAAGRLQAIWPDSAGNLVQTTSDDGVAWSAQTIATAADMRDMRGAGAADHGGVATVTTGTGAGAKVYATPFLAPVMPPGPPQPPRDHPPVASFTFTPALPCTGETVTFDGAASQDYVGTSPTYKWEIGAVETQYRNPEDYFVGSPSTSPRLTRSFGPFREGPSVYGSYPYAKGPVRGNPPIEYGPKYRVPLYITLTVTDESGVASERLTKEMVFGDAGYQPFVFADGSPPLGPTPRCSRFPVPLPVTLAAGGLVTTGATTSVGVGCPRGPGCVGRVTLSTAGLTRPRAAVVRSSRSVKLASRDVVLTAGKKSKIALTLSKSGQRLLRKHRKLRVTVKVAATNQSGKTTTTHRTTTLRLSNHKKA